MKNTQISSMTALEAMDVETFVILSGLFKKARNASITAHRHRQDVFQAVEDMCIDMDKLIPGLHNEITLKDAINIYLHGGNIKLRVILKNLKEWYGVEL